MLTVGGSAVFHWCICFQINTISDTKSSIISRRGFRILSWKQMNITCCCASFDELYVVSKRWHTAEVIIRSSATAYALVIHLRRTYQDNIRRNKRSHKYINFSVWTYLNRKWQTTMFTRSVNDTFTQAPYWSLWQSLHKHVMLSTAVNLRDIDDRLHKCRRLLDCGWPHVSSQKIYMAPLPRKRHSS